MIAGCAPTQHDELKIPNGILAMLFFLAVEVMLFSGLISAFLVIKAGTALWPPSGQPRLPVMATGINTVILLASWATLWLARRRLFQTQLYLTWLGLSVVGGFIFLSLQGMEWIQLLRFGLTLQSSTYGAIFYFLIGMHAIHVLGGLVGLIVVYRKARAGAYALHPEGFEMAFYYWTFVVGIWPVLYGLVYWN